MKMQRTPLMGLIMLIFLVYACNSLQEDVLEPISTQETLETSALPDQALVIDLIERHQPSQPTSFELKNQPQYGEARFIKTGLLLYQPGSDAALGNSDQVVYDVCQNGDCESYDVNITFSNDSTNTGSCVPTFSYQVAEGQEISINLPILLDSLELGFTIDFNSVELIGEPQAGQASYANQTFTYLLDSGSVDTSAIYDVIVYGFQATGDTSFQCYGILEFFRPGFQSPPFPMPLPGDSLALFDDYLCIFGDSAVDVCVTDNDLLDINLVDPSSFKIVQGPQSGMATARYENGKGIINYDPNQGFIGSDFVVYELGYTNGTVGQAQLEIVVLDDSLGGGVDSLFLQAVSDTFAISLSSDTSEYVLGVLLNDIISPNIANEVRIEVLQRPSIGEVQAGNGAIWFFIDPNNMPQVGSLTEFTYQICSDNNWCSEASVTVIFEQ